MLSHQFLLMLTVFSAVMLQPRSDPFFNSLQFFIEMSEQSQQIPSIDFSFQAYAATVMLLVTINSATLIPCHHRGRLLGPELNSMFRLPRQHHSEYWVKPRDSL